MSNPPPRAWFLIIAATGLSGSREIHPARRPIRPTAYATLYSPPPIQASNSVANSMRWRPAGESRTMHSPSEIMSSAASWAPLIFMSEFHRGESTIDGEVAARHETARLAGTEEDSRAHELAGLAEAVHGSMGEDLGHALRLQDFAVLFGGEEARRKRIHPNTLGRPFAREVHRQIQHRRLRRAVREDAREGPDGRHRRDVDDDAALLLVDERLAEN